MTRQNFIDFLVEFREDFKQNKSDWENDNLESFLEAMQGFTRDLAGYYSNRKDGENADVPSWNHFADILRGAKVYE